MTIYSRTTRSKRQFSSSITLKPLGGNIEHTLPSRKKQNELKGFMDVTKYFKSEGYIHNHITKWAIAR